MTILFQIEIPIEMQQTEVKPLFIPIFLGKKGGGEQLAIETLDFLRKSEFDRICIVSSEVSARIAKHEKLVVDIPHSIGGMFNLKKLLRALSSIKLINSKIRKLNSKIIFIQIMPSPFDLLFDLIAKRNNYILIRCIHDFMAHTGEFWPTKRAIKRRIKNSDLIVAFSERIKNQISGISKTVVIKASLPSTIYIGEDFEMEKELETRDLPKLVVIGRAKKYKGYEVLAKALQEVESEYIFSAHGLGEYPENLHRYGQIENRWLSDLELYRYLNESDIVIFPYIEASQSGLLPLAMNFNKLVIVSDAGALPEQVSSYHNAIIFPRNEHMRLAEAITKSIQEIKNSTYSAAPGTQQTCNVSSMAKLVTEYICKNTRKPE